MFWGKTPSVTSWSCKWSSTCSCRIKQSLQTKLHIGHGKCPSAIHKGKSISLMLNVKSVLCCKVKSTFNRWGQALLLWFSMAVFSLSSGDSAGCLCSSVQFYRTTRCGCCRWWTLQASRGFLRKSGPCNQAGHPVYPKGWRVTRWQGWGLRYLVRIFHTGIPWRNLTFSNPVIWDLLSTVNHCRIHVLAVFFYVCGVDVEA